MEYTPHQIKLIKSKIAFGDIATIRRETGYSSQTIHAALKGIAMTQAAKIILAHAELLIRQREERIKTIKK